MMFLQDVRLAVKIQCNYNCEKYLPKIVTFISQCEKFYIVLWVIQIIQRMEKSEWKVIGTFFVDTIYGVRKGFTKIHGSLPTSSISQN